MLQRSLIRRRIALALVFALLLAGYAQASHFHKTEVARASADVQCLLCLHAAGYAGAPDLPTLPSFSPLQTHSPATAAAPVVAGAVAAYDARGPPLS